MPTDGGRVSTVNVVEQHEIAEAGHRILNPFNEEKLMLLGQVCHLAPGARLLDLACGKGEMLCRWAERFGIGGLGVDISEVFLADARARAAELSVADRVSFAHGDAALAVPADASYDVVSCVGATWIGNGLAGTIDLMRPGLRTDGLLLVGEPYWTEPVSDEICGALHLAPEDFSTLEGTLDRLEAAGTSLVEMVLANGDSWDRYMAEQWWTVDRWLRDNPTHPHAEEMRTFMTESRRSHLRYQRRYLGWGVFVLRVN